jgi:hypothetical protein
MFWIIACAGTSMGRMEKILRRNKRGGGCRIKIDSFRKKELMKKELSEILIRCQAFDFSLYAE